MDYRLYAESCGIENVDNFRYACWKGVNAVQKLYEHRNKPLFPLLRPALRTDTCLEAEQIIDNLKNYRYDGVLIESLILENIPNLSDQVQLLKEIHDLNDRKRVLDTTLKYSLPKHTVSFCPSLGCPNVIKIFERLPNTEPFKRSDISAILVAGEDVDDVINALIAFSFI
jgi:hypothetical protein